MKIQYSDFLQRTSFNKNELVAFSRSNLVIDPPLQWAFVLPAPPMLMFDRIVEVSHQGNKGCIVGEQDINLDAWFFQCHFNGDPVQPGCLGVDAVWQLLGFYLALRGSVGAGRALGSKEIDFFGQIRPHNKLVRYEVDIQRYMQSKQVGMSLVVGSARVLVDGEPIYTIKDAKVGAFVGIQYRDYPHLSENAVGGKIVREEKV